VLKLKIFSSPGHPVEPELKIYIYLRGQFVVAWGRMQALSNEVNLRLLQGDSSV